MPLYFTPDTFETLEDPIFQQAIPSFVTCVLPSRPYPPELRGLKY